MKTKLEMIKENNDLKEMLAKANSENIHLNAVIDHIKKFEIKVAREVADTSEDAVYDARENQCGCFAYEEAFAQYNLIKLIMAKVKYYEDVISGKISGFEHRANSIKEKTGEYPDWWKAELKKKQG
tara:strand:+ start:32 stop:409 length:378 start_codon:yes stop_codon:yes gene_type:complete